MQCASNQPKYCLFVCTSVPNVLFAQIIQDAAAREKRQLNILMVIAGSATDYSRPAANLHKTSGASLLYLTLHLSSPTDLHEFDTGSQVPPLGDNIKIICVKYSSSNKRDAIEIIIYNTIQPETVLGATKNALSRTLSDVQ